MKKINSQSINQYAQIMLTILMLKFFYEYIINIHHRQTTLVTALFLATKSYTVSPKIIGYTISTRYDMYPLVDLVHAEYVVIGAICIDTLRHTMRIFHAD